LAEELLYSHCYILSFIYIL
jgi:vacuolar-type H+-ATPase subunit H